MRSALAVLIACACLAACGPRAAVSMRLQPDKQAPPDAAVYVEEQFIGLLGYVAARGVRLPEGKHRISVERDGYFPFDAVVVSDRKPIHLEIQMQRLPE